ncbi:MAG: hypothetical protein DA407_04835 [Bacteroidetes bacterium]|nr:MAG: hypothetical protein DA407_04835 [Bacteroidota bacterium]
MFQTLSHYGIHILVPLIIALIFFKRTWKMAFLVMMATFVIDLDHLLANPIFQANRCSINFHPLHSYYAIILYVLMLIPKTTRLVGLGLCIHILADYVDCLFM